MPKYAVKVPFFTDDKKDWLFVTKDSPDGLEVVLYDSQEEAEKQAGIWNDKGVVVEYTTLD